MTNKKFLTDEEKDQMIELWNQGLSARQIASQLGRGKSTVTDFLSKKGLITSDKLTEEQKQKNP